MERIYNASVNATIPISKTAGLVAGTVMTSELVIFTDHTYLYLAIVGAIVSMFGVLHQLILKHQSSITFADIAVEMIRGLALGLLAIPFWYLVIKEGLLTHILNVESFNVSKSLSLIIAFGLSWYTTQIFDWLTGFIKGKAKNV